MTSLTKLLGAASVAALAAGSAFAQDTSTQTTTTGDQAQAAPSDSGATQGGIQPMTQGTDTETAATGTTSGTGSGTSSGTTQPMQQGGSQTATASPDASGTAGGQTDGQAGSQMAADQTGGQAGTQPGGPSGEQMAALEVESQPVRDGQVKIDLAIMPVDGFVAIHELQDGKLSPDAVGHAPVKAGEEARDVQVSLDEEVPPNTEVVAVLHRDTGEMGTYEFGAQTMTEDGPELIAGRPIAAAFLITSPDAAQQSGSQQSGSQQPMDAQRTGAQQPATMPEDDGSTEPASN